jgi:hypothetical protein
MNESFIERRSYTQKQSYILEMVDSNLQIPAIYPLFFHQKVSTIQQFLELESIRENSQVE